MREWLWLARLALRNALRSPRRTFFTLFSIFLGVGLLVVSQSFVDGIEATLVGIEVRNESAHLRVAPADWFAQEEYQPLDVPFEARDAVRAQLRARFPTATVTGRTSFPAEVGDGRRNLRLRGLAVDPVAYADLLPGVALAAVEGPADQPVVWLGADVASAFGWKVGDTLFLKAKSLRGTLNALDQVRIIGLVASGHPTVDNYTVFLPEGFARGFLDLPEGFATELMARFDDPESADAAAAEVESGAPGLTAETWRERTRDFVEVNQIRRAALNLVVGLILLMAAAGVANTALMSAFERTREIGTLLSLGMPAKRVRRLLILESGLIGGVGTVLGLVVGTVIATHFARHGLRFEVLQQAESVTLMPPILYFELRTSTLLIGATLGLSVAVLAAAWPASRASKLSPIDALRENG